MFLKKDIPRIEMWLKADMKYQKKITRSIVIWDLNYKTPRQIVQYEKI